MRPWPILKSCFVPVGSSFPWVRVVMRPACWFCRWLPPLVVSGAELTRWQRATSQRVRRGRVKSAGVVYRVIFLLVRR
jgi:hypothetical protein